MAALWRIGSCPRRRGVAWRPIWFLVISPARAEDPNFYDLRLSARAPERSCEPGDTTTEPCGACGTAQRICGADGQRPALLEGDCQQEGQCRPGDTLRAACDRCGTRQDVCGQDCAWSAGVCSGQGQCNPGVWQSEDCVDRVPEDSSPGGAPGVRSRVCRDSCAWSAFGPCRSADDPGSACVPQTEDCADGADNDCDGATDAGDLDCAPDQTGGWRLGLSDPCTRTSDCDPDPAKALECIGPPAYPMFEDGYCAQVGCLFPESCAAAGGVCAVAFGQVWCLRPCDELADCRLGHHCATLGEDATVTACLPVCRGHADCRTSPKNFCSPRTGRCEFPPDQPPGTSAAGDAGGCAVRPSALEASMTAQATLLRALRRR